MDAKKVLEVLREIEPSADCCPGMYPKHWMGCKLAALIAAIEYEVQEPGGYKRELLAKIDAEMEVAKHMSSEKAMWRKFREIAETAQQPGENDWQSTVGMFAGDADMEAISEETSSVREAHKVEQPGGWKPGTEPPSDMLMVLIRYRSATVAVGAYHSSIDGYNADRYGSCRLEPENVQWHDLPPLPEEKP